MEQINENKSREETLQENATQLFRSLEDHAPDGIFMVDPQTGRLLEVNQNACNSLGYTREELLTMRVSDLDESWTPERIVEIWQKLSHGDIAMLELVNRRKDGRVIPVEAHVGIFEYGGCRVLLALVRDVTERKQRKEAYERFRYQNELILNAAGEGIFGVDLGGNITFANSAGAKMLGWEVEELIDLTGQTTHAIVHHSKPDGTPYPREECPIYAAFKDGIIHYMDREVFWRKDGTCFPVEYTSTPILEDGKLVGAVVVFRDITERKLAEKALRETLDQLSKKNRYESIISAVTQSVHRSINLQEVLESAIESMSKNIEKVQHIAIFLVEGEEAVLKSYRGYPDWLIKRIERVPYPKGFTWKTIMEGKSIYCADVDQDTAIGPAGRETGIKSYVSMPIYFEGKVVGTLNITSLQKNNFEEDELKLLETVAQQIEIAINNARKAEALQQSEEAFRESLTQLSKKNRYESIISTVTRSVHHSINLQDVLENAVESMNKNIDKVQHVVIFLVEGEEAVLKAQRSYHPDWFMERMKRIPYPKGFTWKTIIEGKSIYCADVDQDTAIGSAGREVGIKSYVSIPIFFEGNAVGALNISSLQKNTFNEDELNLLEVVAQQVGTAINNAQQAEALRKALLEVQQLKNRLQAENIYLQEEIKTEYNFEEIIGQSASIKNVLRNVQKVAPIDTTVLIQGESGTGKEIIARAIHNLSPRKDRPLVKVNCGAISAGLVESELFGHEKGAFTGAVRQRIGRFELADGGTIFLDEVGELSLDTQVKLLRVLQEGEFERVGSSKSIRVDVRIIAATNRNLKEAVKAGSFRSDLFYRLSVFPLEVPSLRERKSDIPILANFFLVKFAKKLNKQLQGISKETMERLMSYPWPGNIRETPCASWQIL